MKQVIIDCAGLQSEAEFWNRYLGSTEVEGAGYFGRNLDAFWDALNGGPGWPGECELQLVNANSLASLRDGRFLAGLHDIARQSIYVKVKVS